MLKYIHISCPWQSLITRGRAKLRLDLTSGAVSDAKEALTMMDLPKDNKKKLRGTGNLKMKQDDISYCTFVCICYFFHKVILSFKKKQTSPYVITLSFSRCSKVLFVEKRPAITPVCNWRECFASQGPNSNRWLGTGEGRRLATKSRSFFRTRRMI